MAKISVKVSKITTPYRSGDWHDPALKWTVQGPAEERQDFCVKKDALKYATIRRRSASQRDAGNAYVRAA